MRSALRSRAGLATIAFAVAACGTSVISPSTRLPNGSPTAPSSQPTTSAAEGSGSSVATTGRILLDERGYAITLSDGWTRINLTGNEVAQIRDAGGSDAYANQFPALKQQLLSTGMSLLALRRPDARISNGTTLTTQDNDIEPIALEDYAAILKSQIEAKLGPTSAVASRSISGAAGKFVRLSFTAPDPDNIALTYIYIFLAKTKQIVTTCASTSVSGIEEECDSVATSLEVLD